MQDTKYGKLKILEECGKNNRGEILYNCQCDCGSTKIVKKFNLTSGNTKSCGCIKTGPSRTCHIGEKHNHLLIVSYVKQSKCRQAIYRCLCDCGSYKDVFYRNIKNNTTKSCGCYSKSRDRCGESNSNYNPNLSYSDRMFRRNLSGYKQWIKSIKSRNNYTCTICQSKTKIVIHHLESFHRNEELRMHDDNAVCICQVCHLKFHKLFGYRNNTKEQFENFVNVMQQKNE